MERQISCGYGKGSIRIRNGKYYFRQFINGKEIEKPLPDVFNDEQALKEAARLRAVASAETVEEIAMVTARAKRIIETSNSLKLADIEKEFASSPLRPECNAKTLEGHSRHISRFLSFIRSIRPEAGRMADITKQDVNRWATSMNDTSSRYYNTHIGTLKLAFRILADHGGISVNPFEHIPLRSGDDTESKNGFTPEQLQLVFRAVDRNYPLNIPERDEMKILFRLGAYTGMRFKDCCLLRGNRIHRNLIKVRTFKTGHEVEIPLHQELEKILSGRNSNDYVLPKIAELYLRDATNVNKTACNIIWWAITPKKQREKQLMERSKHASGVARPERVPGYGFHSFRHTFISFCANAGVPLAVVQEIVGHTSEAVTRIYTHITPETMNQVTAALTAGMSGGKAISPVGMAAKLERIAAVVSAAPKGAKWAETIRRIIED